jgi:hypothetical protein
MKILCYLFQRIDESGPRPRNNIRVDLKYTTVPHGRRILKNLIWLLIVRAVGNDPALVLNIGLRKSRLIETAISTSRESCGDVAIKSLLSGNAAFGENFPKKQSGNFCTTYVC